MVVVRAMPYRGDHVSDDGLAKLGYLAGGAAEMAPVRRTELGLYTLLREERAFQDLRDASQPGGFVRHLWMAHDQRVHDRADLGQVAVCRRPSLAILLNDEISRFEMPQQGRSQVRGPRRVASSACGA